MLTAKVFQSGNSQAILIPQEYPINEKEFYIQKSGNCYFLIPLDDSRALLRQSIGQLDELMDFERDQPIIDDLPERESM